jgi:chromate transporter
MTPGPIAINCATYVGYTVTGNIWGSMLTTFAVSLSPLTLMVLITIFYNRLKSNAYMQGAMKWMKPMICVMIGAAALLFLNGETFIDWKSYAIFAVCFIATWFKVDSILMIVLSAAAGILLYL